MEQCTNIMKFPQSSQEVRKLMNIWEGWTIVNKWTCWMTQRNWPKLPKRRELEQWIHLRNWTMGEHGEQINVP